MQAVARNFQDWEAMATMLLASPRLLKEWKERTHELCDNSGMWWVSWWAKRFSTTLRLSGEPFPLHHFRHLPDIHSLFFDVNS
jgi:hypothetical protein